MKIVFPKSIRAFTENSVEPLMQENLYTVFFFDWAFNLRNDSVVFEIIFWKLLK